MPAKKTLKQTKASTKIKKRQSISSILKSRKVQLLFVVLTFAALGGGYFTYKSFAASTTWTYNRPNGTLTTSIEGNSCKKASYDEPQKNKMPVWSLTCPGTPSLGDLSGYNGAAEARTLGAFLAAGTAKYRFCAYVKGVAPDVMIQVLNTPTQSSNITPASASNLTIKKFNSSAYQYICGANFTVIKSGGIQGSVRIGLDPITKSTSWINVSSIILEKL